MANNTLIVIRREFLERVKKKSFIITTLIMPLVMLALMVTPVLISMYATGDAKKVMVIDRSQVLAPGLTDSETITFTDMPASEGDDYWKHALDNEEVDAVLIIPADIVDGAAGVKLYTAGASSMNLEMEITSRLNSLIENQRIQNYGYKDLRQIIDAVHSDVSLQSITYDGDDEKASSTTLSYILGIALTMMLYMCLLIYGQMVMTSIIEEKGNRVLELVVSSVKPTQLMLGKICGIGLVAVTQIIIWGVLIAAMSAFLLPALLPADVAAQVTAINAGGAAGGEDIGIIQAISVLGNVGYIIRLFGLLLLFLIGGFMLYSAIYAAIGSAVDNIQDAGQLQSIIVVPIIFGIIFGMMAASDPTSSLSLWTSMIPFTSPMVMMARIPFGIPMWQIAMSLVILYLSFFCTVWLAGKIYRVGIFMYGKKPTLKELVRWMRYK